MKYFICSKCHKKKQTRPQRYRAKLAEYGGNRDLLKSKYICRNCRYKAAKKWIYHKDKKNIVPTATVSSFSFNKSSEYIETVKKLNELAMVLHLNGIEYKNNRDAFYHDVKKLLSKQNIVDFIINILDNKVKSISIRNIPFIKIYEIDIGDK